MKLAPTVAVFRSPNRAKIWVCARTVPIVTRGRRHAVMVLAPVIKEGVVGVVRGLIAKDDFPTKSLISAMSNKPYPLGSALHQALVRLKLNPRRRLAHAKHWVGIGPSMIGALGAGPWHSP